MKRVRYVPITNTEWKKVLPDNSMYAYYVWGHTKKEMLKEIKRMFKKYKIVKRKYGYKVIVDKK